MGKLPGHGRFRAGRPVPVWRRGGPVPGWRAAAAGALAAGLVGLTACGGSSPGSASSGQPASYQQMVAYAQCIRSHGAPEFPDPVQVPSGGWGFLSSPGSGVDGPGVPAAEKACQKLAPKQVPFSVSFQRKMRTMLLKLATCMRAHGITNFPDPVINSNQISIAWHPNPQSPQDQAAQKACQAYRPAAQGSGGK